MLVHAIVAVVSAGMGYGFRGFIRRKLGYVEVKAQAAAAAVANASAAAAKKL